MENRGYDVSGMGAKSSVSLSILVTLNFSLGNFADCALPDVTTAPIVGRVRNRELYYIS
jgi:hypothetical protein